MLGWEVTNLRYLPAQRLSTPNFMLPKGKAMLPKNHGTPLKLEPSPHTDCRKRVVFWRIVSASRF